MIFKTFRFKQDAQDQKMFVFNKMKQESDNDKWKELKDQYDTYDKMENPGGHISIDTVVSITGTFIMLLTVLYFEKLDIVTSKAWNWIKPNKF